MPCLSRTVTSLSRYAAAGYQGLAEPPGVRHRQPPAVIVTSLDHDHLRRSWRKHPYQGFPVVLNGELQGLVTRAHIKEALEGADRSSSRKPSPALSTAVRDVGDKFIASPQGSWWSWTGPPPGCGHHNAARLLRPRHHDGTEMARSRRLPDVPLTVMGSRVCIISNLPYSKGLDATLRQPDYFWIFLYTDRSIFKITLPEPGRARCPNGIFSFIGQWRDSMRTRYPWETGGSSAAFASSVSMCISSL